MSREGVEGLPVERQEIAAANEEFAGNLNRRDVLSRRSGWDPFEVWATRVKERRKKPRGVAKSHDRRR